MRLSTLVALMLTALGTEFEEHFAFKDNLSALLSFFDILKSSNHFSTTRSNKKKGRSHYDYKILVVKFNFSPSIEDVICRLARMLNSETSLLIHINDSNIEAISFLLKLSRDTTNFLENMHNCETRRKRTKHGLKLSLNRCKTANLLLGIISRFQELGGTELSHSFKIFRSIRNFLSKKHELIGGIIYFLFILCFEAFTPGLTEFVRISLKDLDQIIEINPYIDYFNAEMNLIRSVLALNTRTDQLAIDCLIHFFVFDFPELDECFGLILKTSLGFSTNDKLEIAIKLITKFGNQNLLQLFVKSYGLLENSRSNLPINEDKNRSLAQNWMIDLNYHIKLNGLSQI